MHLNYDSDKISKMLKSIPKLLNTISILLRIATIPEYGSKETIGRDQGPLTKKATSKRKLLIGSQVREKYLDALERDDIEAPQDAFEDCQLPHVSAQVHSEYTLHGHFFFLRRTLANVETIRLLLDQDPGMRAACIGAFFYRIQDMTCDAFYISTNNEASIHERKRIHQKSAELIAATMSEQDLYSEYQAQLYLLAKAIEESISIFQWQDRCFEFQYIHAKKFNKIVYYITNYNNYKFKHFLN